ncbi:MAG TPA: DHH family phosphoesterase, partial [Thermoanaerobaculia bacterium]|nr:DHH family phosphoesterase [Thermoanaerobaculia bacterium]
MSAVLSAVDQAYEEAARVLHTGRRFLVTGHRNPDGDALGSALGLALAATDAGKDVSVVMRDGFSSAYSFLPGIERVVVTDALPADWPDAYDAAFAMECPEPDRIGFPLLAPSSRAVVVNVDHHPGNTNHGNVNLVDLPAAATGEIVADLLDRLEWPLTPAVA